MGTKTSNHEKILLRSFIAGFIFLLITIKGQSQPSYTNSISQHGITWIFDKQYLAGKFINGDWWVCPDTIGGTVKVNSVTPAPTTIAWRAATADINGSMVNPIFNGAPYGHRQGFDSRGGNYRSVGDSPLDNGHVYRVVYPLELPANSSLISTESWTTDTIHHYFFGTSVTADHSFLKNAAVLTVIDTPMPASAFRPPYWGNQKTIFDTTQIKWHLLPKLAPNAEKLIYPYKNPTSGLPQDSPCTVYKRIFERPWLFWEWETHPTENMPGYYEVVQTYAADASALLLVNYPDRNNLLIPFLQTAIDNYYATPGVGHSTGDRGLMKWLSIFSGIMFDDADMKTPNYPFKTEDTYYRKESQSNFASTTVPPTEFWMEQYGFWNPPLCGKSVGWRSDLGDKEFEHLDPTATREPVEIYYNGSDPKGTIQVSTDSYWLYLRTYSANSLLLSEYQLKWRATATEQQLGILRFDDLSTLVSAINSSCAGWNAQLATFLTGFSGNIGGIEGACLRQPKTETNAYGQTNKVKIKISEWDLLPNLGARKQETYRHINSHPWPGFALAAYTMQADKTWGHSAFFDYVDRWMAEDWTLMRAAIEDGTSPYNPNNPSGKCSSDFVQYLWNTYRPGYNKPDTLVFSSITPACINDSPFPLSGGWPTGGTYSGTGVNGGVFDPSVAGVGTHTITYLYTNGCGVSDSLTQPLVVNPLPVITFSLLPHICIDEASFTLNGGIPAGGTYSGNGLQGNMFNPQLAGIGTHTINYTYTNNGCHSTKTQTITVSTCTGVEEENDIKKIIAYPNPSKGEIAFYIPHTYNQTCTMKIYNPLGETVYEQVLATHSTYMFNFRSHSIPPGVYVVYIQNENTHMMEKIIFAER